MAVNSFARISGTGEPQSTTSFSKYTHLPWRHVCTCIGCPTAVTPRKSIGVWDILILVARANGIGDSGFTGQGTRRFAAGPIRNIKKRRIKRAFGKLH